MTKNKETSDNSPTRFPFSSTTLLQLNGTIIAGLLILLTFQLSELPSQEDAVQQLRKLDIEESLLTEKLKNSSDNLKNKISDKLDDIQLERESIREEFTAVTHIPYVIYVKSNPLVFGGMMIVLFVLSSMVMMMIGRKHRHFEEFSPKLATLLTNA